MIKIAVWLDGTQILPLLRESYSVWGQRFYPKYLFFIYIYPKTPSENLYPGYSFYDVDVIDMNIRNTYRNYNFPILLPSTNLLVCYCKGLFAWSAITVFVKFCMNIIMLEEV